MLRMTILTIVLALTSVTVAVADSGEAAPFDGPADFPVLPVPGCTETVRWDEYGTVIAHIPQCNGKGAVVPGLAFE